MIKRVNFTGRKRIPRSRVEIEVYDGEPRQFAASIDIAQYGFPADAEIIIEATCAGSTNICRFGFGTAGKLEQPQDCLLNGLAGENVFFSLKVVDRTNKFGRILGLAENIRPIKAGKQTATGRRGILPIERVAMGQELWRLDFKEQDVFLCVNKDVGDLSERFGFDPLFFTTLYPGIIRTILHRGIGEQPDIDSDDDRWPVLWLNFGRRIHSSHLDPPPADDLVQCEEWVEDVVEQFCRLHQLKQKYVESGSIGWGDDE